MRRAFLTVEYLDSDDYHLRNILLIPLAEDPNLTVHDNVLHVANVNGTIHYVPLTRVKQYYKTYQDAS